MSLGCLCKIESYIQRDMLTGNTSFLFRTPGLLFPALCCRPSIYNLISTYLFHSLPFSLFLFLPLSLFPLFSPCSFVYYCIYPFLSFSLLLSLSFSLSLSLFLSLCLYLSPPHSLSISVSISFSTFIFGYSYLFLSIYTYKDMYHSPSILLAPSSLPLSNIFSSLYLCINLSNS